MWQRSMVLRVLALLSALAGVGSAFVAQRFAPTVRGDVPFWRADLAARATADLFELNRMMTLGWWAMFLCGGVSIALLGLDLLLDWQDNVNRNRAPMSTPAVPPQWTGQRAA